jgi:hypothetical protein
MTNGGCAICSSRFRINQQILWTIAALVLAADCLAQTPQAQGGRRDVTLQADSQTPSEPPPPEQKITVPAGTRLPLVLTYPVDSRSARELHAQTTAPVVVDGKVAIPPGTFVQGKIQRVSRHGSRARMELRPAALVFANGYVATVPSAMSFESDEETASANPSSATKAAIFLAPEVGLGIGAAIGAAAHTTNTTTFAGQTTTTSSPKGLAIGSIAGLAAGGVVSVVLLARSHHFYVEGGSPLEASLPEPLTLSELQVSAAVEKAAAQPVLTPIASRPPSASAQAPGPSTGPASCSAGQEWCKGQCVASSAFINDDSNCGRCGNSCSINESCSGGSCGCAPGYESCMGQCVNSASFTSDSFNCGRCENSCSAGESCFGGTCRKPGM